MAKVIFGNHSPVLVPQQDRDSIRKFYCDVLGGKHPDSIDLAAKARAADVPTPEGRQARAIILRVVAQGLT